MGGWGWGVGWGVGRRQGREGNAPILVWKQCGGLRVVAQRGKGRHSSGHRSCHGCTKRAGQATGRQGRRRGLHQPTSTRCTLQQNRRISAGASSTYPQCCHPCSPCRHIAQTLAPPAAPVLTVARPEGPRMWNCSCTCSRPSLSLYTLQGVAVAGAGLSVTVRQRERQPS